MLFCNEWVGNEDSLHYLVHHCLYNVCYCFCDVFIHVSVCFKFANIHKKAHNYPIILGQNAWLVPCWQFPGMPCAPFCLAKRCVFDCHPAHIARPNAPFGKAERTVWRPGRGRFVTLGVPPVALAQSERGLARGKCKAPLCSFRAPLRAARAWLSAAAGRRCLPAAEWRRPRRPVTVS